PGQALHRQLGASVLQGRQQHGESVDRLSDRSPQTARRGHTRLAAKIRSGHARASSGASGQGDHGGDQRSGQVGRDAFAAVSGALHTVETTQVEDRTGRVSGGVIAGRRLWPLVTWYRSLPGLILS